MSTNGHKGPRERIVDALRRNNGRLTLRELQKDYYIKKSEVEDLLVLPPDQNPIRIEYFNGTQKPTTFVHLKDFVPPAVATQAEVAKKLNGMTPDQYRQFLISIDPSFKSRLARRGYRRRGISVEEYFGG
jgi:hypothetical protein